MTEDHDDIETPEGQPATQSNATPKRSKTRVRTAQTPSGLTEKQEAFAQAVAREGKNFSAAYREAYNTENMTPGSIWTAASALGRHDAVSLRIEEIQEEIREENSASAATRAERVIATLESRINRRLTA